MRLLGPPPPKRTSRRPDSTRAPPKQATPASAALPMQPRVTTSKVQVPARKRVPVPPVVDLSPIKGSPQASPPASSAKHNVMSLTAAAAHSRRPLAAIGARRENLPQPPRVASKDTTPKIRPLADLTGANRNNHTKEQKKRDSVKDRGASGSGRSSG